MSRFALLCVVVAGCGRIGFDAMGDEGDGGKRFAIQNVRLVAARDVTRPTIIAPLDGARLDVSPWLPMGFSIEADVADMPEIVRFRVNGGNWEENVAPYVSRGDDNDHAAFFDRELRVGMNTVVVTSETGPTMTVEDQKTVTFELAVPMPTGALTGLALVDAQSGSVLQPLTGGESISIASLPARVDLEVTTSPAIIGAVKFDVTGVMPHNDTSRWPPYRAYSNASGFVPQQGSYAITATPHDHGDGTGAAGTPITLSFSFIP